LDTINKITGAILITLSVVVCIPLSVITWQTRGGTMGLGMVGLAILLPLSAYIIFGIAAFFGNPRLQRGLFVSGHIVSILIGIASLIIFPVYPKAFVAAPVLLALAGISSGRRIRYFLLGMIMLGVIANVLLLSWELDAGRNIPAAQVFYGEE
jgi:hypothetical protein